MHQFKIFNNEKVNKESFVKKKTNTLKKTYIKTYQKDIDQNIFFR